LEVNLKYEKNAPFVATDNIQQTTARVHFARPKGLLNHWLLPQQ
jgi:hypothetical protein